MKSEFLELPRRLILCLGPGGVGKTTLAAALAMRQALAGRAVDVMTVDPAPRLLDALHLEPGVAGPQTVELGALKGTAHGAGRLRALRLEAKTTFDELIQRHAPTPAVAQAILANRLYQGLSTSLTGVAEYMAMEKLLELYDRPETDLVVLDTPPAREALDYLGAPRRLLDLLNSRAGVLLGTTLRQGAGISDLATRTVLSAFDRLTGLHLLSDVRGFVASFESMFEGFATRAARADALVHGEAAVVVVTVPESYRIEHTLEFLQSLRAVEISAQAVVVNRCAPPLPPRAELRQIKSAPLRRKLERNWEDFNRLAAAQAEAIQTLAAGLPKGVELLSAPELEEEPATLGALAELAEQIASLPVPRRPQPARRGRHQPKSA